MAVRRNQARNIALCGYHGCGKTSVGWELAKHFAGAESYVTSIKHNFIQLPLLNDKRAKEAFLASGVYGIDRVLKHAGTSVTETCGKVLGPPR